MANTKTYIINGKQYKQQLLSLRQAQFIFEIFFDVGIDDIANLADMKIADIVKLLFSKQVLSKLLYVILIPVDKQNPSLTPDEILDLNTDQLEELVVDFFALNPKLITYLKDFVSTLAGMSLTSISRVS